MTLRPLLFALPALALTACGGSPPPPRPIVIAPQAATPVVVTPPPVYSGSSVAPGAAMHLSPGETQSLLVNNTAVGVTANGTPYDVYFANDGTAHFSSQTTVDRGTWHVTPDGSLCSNLPHIAPGAERCYAIVRYGNVILYQRPDGTAEGSIRVIAGNPLNL